jgi:large subunit ribosomal protein L22e
VIDYSKPAADGVFDGADFEKFLHDRIKVDGKAGQLGESVKVTRDSQLYLTSFTYFTEYPVQTATKSPLYQISLSPSDILNT